MKLRGRPGGPACKCDQDSSIRAEAQRFLTGSRRERTDTVEFGWIFTH